MNLPFENDTNAIVKKLANRSMKADRRRNLFVILAIALASALMVAIFCSASALERKTEDDIRGQYQAVVVNCDQAMIDRLAANPKVEKFGLSQDYGTSRYEDSVLSVEYADENWMELGKKPPYTGEMPRRADEILVERAFLEYFHLPVETGQKIHMNLGMGEQDYTVTGIMDAENTSRYFMLIVSREFVEEMAQGEPLFEFRLRFVGADKSPDMDQLKADIAEFLAGEGVLEDQIFYSSNYFDMQGFRAGSTLVYVPVALLILVACAFVIYSIFYISVRGKLREYGRLKVIGTTPKQIRRIVRREGAVLSAVGISVGLLIGGAVGYFTNPAYWSFSGNLPYLLGVVAATAFMVFLSTNTPVRLAAKVSPIEAVRNSGYTADTDCRKGRRSARRITPATLAGMNFYRSRKKAVMTLVSLGMTGVFVLAAATVLRSIDVENMAVAAMGDGANYTISWHDSVGFENIPDTARDNPLNESLQKELLALDGVEKVTPHQCTAAELVLPGKKEWFQIQVFNREMMERWLPQDALIEGTADYDELAEQNGIIITDASDHLLAMYYDYTPAVGDRLAVRLPDGGTFEVTVMGIAKSGASDGTGIGALFAMPEDVAHKIYPDIANLDTCWNVHTGTDSDALRTAIFQLLENPVLEITARTDVAAVYETYLMQMAGGIYLLLAFLFLFSLVNLVNTLMANLIARQQELGVLQSIGMTARQVSFMLVAECLWYVLATLGIAVVLGGAVGAMLVRALNGFQLFGELVYCFPVTELLVFAIALLAVTGIFAVVAVWYSKRQTLVERIRMID